MTTATLVAQRPTLGRRTVSVGLLVLGAAATAAGALFGNGNPLFAVAPVILAFGTYAFYVLPIRYAMFASIFLSLVLDMVDEGRWSSPLAPLGTLLGANLSKTIPIGALALPGVAFLMLAMLALTTQRSLIGDRTDSQGRTPIAHVLMGGLAVSFLTVMAWVVMGRLRGGGDLQMAKLQVQNFVLMLLGVYLAAMSFRGLRDYKLLGQLIIGAAVVRAIYVVYVIIRLTPGLAEGQIIAVAATHGDSLLFATATVLLLVQLLEKPSLRAACWCGTLLPVLLVGMHLNNRRIVWIEVIAGMLTYILVSRRSHSKKVVANLGLLALPLFIVYLIVGWDSQARIFAPIKTYRSVTEGENDSSTLYRDIENYNLTRSMRVNPITGLGFGHAFGEDIALPDISFAFKEYRFVPHNAILGLWVYVGPFGFTGLWMVAAVGVYLAMRSYRIAEAPDERIAAAMVLAVVAIHLVHSWGDMGFNERRIVFLLGPALALAGQLAYATGAYRPRPVKKLTA